MKGRYKSCSFIRKPIPSSLGYYLAKQKVVVTDFQVLTYFVFSSPRREKGVRIVHILPKFLCKRMWTSISSKTKAKALISVISCRKVHHWKAVCQQKQYDWWERTCLNVKLTSVASKNSNVGASGNGIVTICAVSMVKQWWQHNLSWWPFKIKILRAGRHDPHMRASNTHRFHWPNFGSSGQNVQSYHIFGNLHAIPASTVQLLLQSRSLP